MAAEHCDRKQQGSKRHEIESEHRIRHQKGERQGRRSEKKDRGDGTDRKKSGQGKQKYSSFKCKSRSKWKMANGSPFQQHLNFD